ncbi:MAG: ATP-dependent Clp protease proteolytic subunit [Myxococcales bacterium]|nr:ATP-dependent Clp protease proteolytic subunit [Myxococcales bacterium]
MLRKTIAALALLLLVSGTANALELTSRQVHLSGSVSLSKVQGITEKLIKLNSVSHDPIFLMINSPGGSVAAGFVLIDVMKSIESPVYAVIESAAYSMGAIIAVFCSKRYMYKHATMMFHEASYGTLGEDPSIRSRIGFNSRYLDKLHKEIAARIGMSPKQYRTKIRDGWWLLADEAKKAGVIDEVVEKISYRHLFIEKITIKKTVTEYKERQISPPTFKPTRKSRPPKRTPR